MGRERTQTVATFCGEERKDTSVSVTQLRARGGWGKRGVGKGLRKKKTTKGRCHTSSEKT